MSLEPSDILAARPSFDERYELRARLWHDGPHAGYLALDRVLGRVVMVNIAYRARDAAVMIEKARILALLQHRHILPILDHGVTGEGLPYFTRPKISLEPMDFMVRRLETEGTSSPGDFPLKPLVAAVREACRAVIHARSLGYCHDDLHPGSILIGGEFREVFVADGWARIRRKTGGEESNPDPSAFQCRLEYMDPRCASDRRESHEPQDDVFAFGGILPWSSMGRRPTTIRPSPTPGNGSKPSLAGRPSPESPADSVRAFAPEAGGEFPQPATLSGSASGLSIRISPVDSETWKNLDEDSMSGSIHEGPDRWAALGTDIHESRDQTTVLHRGGHSPRRQVMMGSHVETGWRCQPSHKA